MQISRHWRMNAQRYRLEGLRQTSSETSLQDDSTQARREKTLHESVSAAKETVKRNAKVNAA